MRAAEDATQAANLVVGFRPLIRNPHVRVDVFHLALLPFALALGLDIFITASRIFGEFGGAGAGTAAAVLAIAFWYGLPRMRKRHAGEQERAMTSSQ
jgi:hypothetical protein